MPASCSNDTEWSRVLSLGLSTPLESPKLSELWDWEDLEEGSKYAVSSLLETAGGAEDWNSN